MNGGPSFKAVSEAAARQAEAFCRRYLPAGKRSGDWWIAAVPWRADKNPSLGVKLSTGKWQDFGRGDHGDMIDLLGRVNNLTAAEAKVEMSKLVGLAL